MRCVLYCVYPQLCRYICWWLLYIDKWNVFWLDWSTSIHAYWEQIPKSMQIVPSSRGRWTPCCPHDSCGPRKQRPARQSSFCGQNDFEENRSGAILASPSGRRRCQGMSRRWMPGAQHFCLPNIWSAAKKNVWFMDSMDFTFFGPSSPSVKRSTRPQQLPPVQRFLTKYSNVVNRI